MLSSLNYCFLLKKPENNENKLTLSRLEVQESDNYKYWNLLSPAERLNKHLNMICRIYNHDTEKNDGYANELIIFIAAVA